MKVHILWQSFVCAAWALTSHLNLPVICGGLVKLLSNLEVKLCVLNGALGLQCHLITVQGDNRGGLGQVPHLARGKTHACTNQTHRQGNDQLRVTLPPMVISSHLI